MNNDPLGNVILNFSLKTLSVSIVLSHLSSEANSLFSHFSFFLLNVLKKIIK